MTGKGTLTTAPDRRLRWVMGAHLLWLLFVAGQSAWWVSLLGSFAPDERTRRMIHMEFAAFVGVMIAGAGVLLWLYWRDSMRSRSMQAFFASVTHELRTPLTSIRLQAESLAESHLPGDPDHELVRRLLEDTSRLESQVERTLELARVEGGGRVHAEALRLKPVVERALGQCRETFRDRVKVTSALGRDAAVRADSGALQVVLRNLIENSIRHSGRPETSISVALVEGAPGRVGLRFADDGEGFRGDPAKLGALFAKGPGSTGTGVGLYLVKVLMERMGGRAEFRPGAGGSGFEALLWFVETDREAANGG